ncbi:BIIDXI-like protein At5g11420 [Miscanthus floridulus]|uniref:BIIDXI-like protein At5g11420 n=1 Tax=Miscanthus floridulus TaxID=154761 RepID=UPI003458E3CE
MGRGSETVLNARRAALFLIVCLAARAASAIQDGLLPNGNFEEAPPKSQLNGTRVMGRYAIPHWEISGYVEYIGSGQKQGDMLLPVPEGAYAVRLGNEASIQQRLALTQGAHYSITFSAARTCAQAEQLNVTVAPESDILPIQTVYSSSGWDSYSWAFKATGSVVSLIVHNPGVAEDAACGPLIDLFAIKTLPTPQSSKNNMLKNGDFEEGPYIFPNARWGVLVPPMDEDDYSPLSPWMILSSTKSVKYVDAPHHVVPHGARAVELVSGMETALVQNVTTVPGLPYMLQFSVGDAGNGCVGSMSVQAYAASRSVKVPYQSQGKGGYKRGALDFTATADQTRVVFVSMGYIMKPDGTLCGPVVDDVSLVCTRNRPARRLLL